MSYKEEITPEDLLNDPSWLKTAKLQAIKNGERDTEAAVRKMAEQDAETYNTQRAAGMI